MWGPPRARAFQSRAHANCSGSDAKIDSWEPSCSKRRIFRSLGNCGVRCSFIRRHLAGSHLTICIQPEIRRPTELGQQRNVLDQDQAVRRARFHSSRPELLSNALATGESVSSVGLGRAISSRRKARRGKAKDVRRHRLCHSKDGRAEM